MARSIYAILLVLVLLQTELSAGWAKPETVGPDSSVNSSLAVDAQGNAFAVFTQSDETNTWIKASKRPAGGKWSAPVAISQPTPRVEFPSAYASIAVNEKGDAVAVWNMPDENMIGAMQIAILPAGSDSWVAVEEPLTKLARIEGFSLHLDAHNHALIIWSKYEEDSGEYTFETIRFDMKSMQGESLDVVDKLLGISFWDAGIDPSGNVYLLWQESPDNLPVPNNVKVASLASGSKSWSEPEVLVESSWVYSCQLAIDSQGNVLALWKQQATSSSPWELKIFKHPAGANAWVEGPSPQGSVWFIGYEELAFDAAGNAYLAWQTKDYRYPVVFSKWVVKTNAWSTPIKVMPAAESMRLGCFGVDSAGNALFVWENSDQELIKASTLPSGSNAWSLPATLTSGSLGTSWPSLTSTQQTWIFLYEESEYPADLVNALIGVDLFPTTKVKKQKYPIGTSPLKGCPCKKL